MKRNAVVFDVDGTLAIPTDFNGRWDWTDVEYCKRVMASHKPEPRIISLLRSVRFSGESIIISTARPDMYRRVTEEWFRRNGISHEMMLMRPDNNVHSDHVIKVVHAQAISDLYNIQYWVEDRQSVVDALREIGIMVLQCAKGDY